MSDDNNTATALKEAVKLGQQLGAPRTDEPIHYTVIPSDSELVSLEEFQFGQSPARKKASVTLFDADSFVEYVNLFGDEHTRIFSNPERGALSFLAIIDYHSAGEGPAMFLSHRAAFKCQTSDEWKAWSAANGKRMGQPEFAEFLEDNAPDISDPSSAFMLEVARDIQAHSEVTFSSAIRLENGQHQLVYQEEIKGGVGKGNIEIPETFKIRIPIFLGSDPRQITARLRYRITQGKITFWFDLHRANTVIDEAFHAIKAHIAEQTKTQVLLGSV